MKETQLKHCETKLTVRRFHCLALPTPALHDKKAQKRWLEVTNSIYKQVLPRLAQYSCARCGHALGMPNIVYERRRQRRWQFDAVWRPPHVVAKKMTAAACRCSVPNCTATTRNSAVSFFRFPKSVSRQVRHICLCFIAKKSLLDDYSATEWAMALDRTDLLDKVTRLHNSSYRVCGMHFRREMFASDLRNRLSKHAVPMLIPPIEQPANHHSTAPVLTTTIFLIQQAPPSNNKGNLRLGCFNFTTIYFVQVRIFRRQYHPFNKTLAQVGSQKNCI